MPSLGGHSQQGAGRATRLAQGVLAEVPPHAWEWGYPGKPNSRDSCLHREMGTDQITPQVDIQTLSQETDNTPGCTLGAGILNCIS